MKIDHSDYTVIVSHLFLQLSLPLFQMLTVKLSQKREMENNREKQGVALKQQDSPGAVPAPWLIPPFSVCLVYVLPTC